MATFNELPDNVSIGIWLCAHCGALVNPVLSAPVMSQLSNSCECENCGEEIADPADHIEASVTKHDYSKLAAVLDWPLF